MEYSAPPQKSKLDEAGLELQDSAADKISQMLERFNQRLTLSNPRLIERYLKSELHIMVSYRWCGEEYVAYFERAQDVLGLEEDAENGRLIFFSPSLLHKLAELRTDITAQICAFKGRHSSEQQAMLVDDVQFVEHPKIVTLPSIVWFDSPDRIFSVLPHALYFSLKQGFVFRGALLDRKVDVSPKPLGLVRSNKEKLLRQMIERAPKVVKNITGDSCKNDRGFPKADYVMNVAIDSNFIGAGFSENPNLACQIDDVFFGPFNFDFNERKSFIGGHL